MATITTPIQQGPLALSTDPATAQLHTFRCRSLQTLFFMWGIPDVA